MQQRSLATEPKYLAADYGHDVSFFVNYGYQQLLLMVHKGNNCTGSHSDLIHMLCGQEGIVRGRLRASMWAERQVSLPVNLRRS